MFYHCFTNKNASLASLTSFSQTNTCKECSILLPQILWLGTSWKTSTGQRAQGVGRQQAKLIFNAQIIFDKLKTWVKEILKFQSPLLFK